MLSTHVKTTRDLLSIALQAEREAIKRYTELNQNMLQANNEPAAKLFQRLINEEEEHEQLLLDWMSKNNLEENNDIGPISWSDPTISTTYNNEAKDPSYSTPYRALAFAVHNEEIAFRFYTHVAANATNQEIREYAETLAREELGHAALLRAERRRAYHQEQSNISTEPKLHLRTIHNEVDLITTALEIDNILLNITEQVRLSGVEITGFSILLQENINKNHASLESHQHKNSTQPNEQILYDLDQLKIFSQNIIKKLDVADSLIRQLLAYCDHSFSFYDALVESQTTEEIMLLAQEFSELALDRIGILKKVLSNSDI